MFRLVGCERICCPRVRAQHGKKRPKVQVLIRQAAYVSRACSRGHAALPHQWCLRGWLERIPAGAAGEWGKIWPCDWTPAAHGGSQQDQGLQATHLDVYGETLDGFPRPTPQNCEQPASEGGSSQHQEYLATWSLSGMPPCLWWPALQERTLSQLLRVAHASMEDFRPHTWTSSGRPLMDLEASIPAYC